MELIAITNRAAEAAAFERCMIDRIMVDLEVLGKAERQIGRPTWISDHQREDITAVKAALNRSTLVVRINPINPKSKAEIDDAIMRGADILMLPMARTVQEVGQFVEYVEGRNRTCLLLETADLLDEIDAIVAIRGLDEIHVGLNDLHLSLGMKCMFQVLSDGLLDYLAKAAFDSGKRLGIGGVGALGTGEIDPQLILNEHMRLGSSMVILSRSFFAGIDRGVGMEVVATVAPRVKKLREYIESIKLLPPVLLSQNRVSLHANVVAYLDRHHKGTSTGS